MKQTRPVAIVCTTIHPVGEFLRRYYENIAAFGRLREATVVVVGDKKTPAMGPQAAPFIEKGLDVRLLDLEEQEAFLQDEPGLGEIVPFNSDSRRNIGYFYAYRGGAEIVVSVDDDNYPLPEDDFVAGHRVAGQKRRLPLLRSSNRWYNILQDAQTSNGSVLYPRGFPHSRRHQNPLVGAEEAAEPVFLCANVGLWTGHPDVDAVTRIENPAQILGYPNGGLRGLGRGTLTPINSQNTAVCREALAAYYNVPQGQEIGGLRIERFGDIWQGLFLKKCADAMGHGVSFGRPLCRHERNAHDPFDDLRGELEGMRCTETLCEFLEQTELEGKSYRSCYLELAERLEEHYSRKETNYGALFASVSARMQAWASLFGAL